MRAIVRGRAVIIIVHRPADRRNASFGLASPLVDGLGARMLAAAGTTGMDAHNFGFFFFTADFARSRAGLLDP
jgi:hypothetical protein